MKPDYLDSSCESDDESSQEDEFLQDGQELLLEAEEEIRKVNEKKVEEFNALFLALFSFSNQ